MLVQELFGFRPNLKSRKAICELNNKVVIGINDKLCLLVIFCDLEESVSLC